MDPIQNCVKQKPDDGLQLRSSDAMHKAIVYVKYMVIIVFFTPAPD